MLLGMTSHMKRAKDARNFEIQAGRSTRVENLITEKLTVAGAFTRRAQRQLENGMRDEARSSARTTRGMLQEAWDIAAVLPVGHGAMRDRIAASDRELRVIEVELIRDLRH